MTELHSGYISAPQLDPAIIDDYAKIASMTNNNSMQIHQLRVELDNEIYQYDEELHRLTQRILSLEIIVGVSIGSLVSMLYFPVQTVLIITAVLLLILATVPWGVFTDSAQKIKGFVQLFLIEITEAWKFYRPKGDDDE